jgi:predicted nucleic acid-binding protein
MPCVLDTSALLAHCRNEKGSDGMQELCDAENDEIFLCSVSLPELTRRLREVGADERGISDLVTQYEQLADEIVPVDESIAEHGDDLIREATARLPLVDALIVSAVRTRDAVLVHLDSHMRAIPYSLVRRLDLNAPATTL